MKENKRSYDSLIRKIPKIEKYFEIEWLEIPKEDYKLVKFVRFFSSKYPTLIIMAGMHGDEPAATLILFQKYYNLARKIAESKVNLVVYPLINPYGYEKNYRFNRFGFNCNRNWIHPIDKQIASEVEILKKDFKKYKPKIFIDFHEDDDTQNEFYLFTFGNRIYEKPLMRIGQKYFSVLRNSYVSNAYSFELGVYIKNGVVYEECDSSVEDYMFHQGIDFTCCIETPSAQPLRKRKECIYELIFKVIDLTKN